MACRHQALTMRAADSAALRYAGARNVMPQERDSPFATLESAYEFVSLLREAVDDAQTSILDEKVRAQAVTDAERRLHALYLVDHKLNRLRQHVLASQVLLNDLRTLRRLLLGERHGSGADTDPL